jgi:hypothetical protein
VYTDELEQKQRDWSLSALELIRDLLPRMAPLGRFAKWEGRQGRTVGELASAAPRSTESLLLLTAYGQLWDAEMPGRSITEASLKMGYLLQQRETFVRRHQEYSVELFELALLKDHQKAVAFLEVASDPSNIAWKPIRDRVLSDEQLDELRTRYDRNKRRELEQRWSFSGLIEILQGSGDPLFLGVSGLSHRYSVGSHILHADTVGTSIPLERDYRPPERRDTLHLAHCRRLIADALGSFVLRLSVAYRFVGADLAPVVDTIERIRKFETCFEGVYDNWIETEYETPSASKTDIVG